MNCPECNTGLFDDNVLSEAEYRLFQIDFAKEFRSTPDRKSIEWWESWKHNREMIALKLLSEVDGKVERLI